LWKLSNSSTKLIEAGLQTMNMIQRLSAIGLSFCVGLLVLLSGVPASLAVTVDQVPLPIVADGAWITDLAETLTPATKASLNQAISELHQKNETNLVVVTVPHVEQSPSPRYPFAAAAVEQFARDLFKRWHLNRVSERNVLVLVSVDDRRIEIRTNRAASVQLPNDYVQRIIHAQFIPPFKAGDLNRGVLDGTIALINAVQYAQPVRQARRSHMWIVAAVPVVFLLALVGIALSPPGTGDESGYHNIDSGGGGSNGGGAGGSW
jgi:uncharacterized protein